MRTKDEILKEKVGPNYGSGDITFQQGKIIIELLIDIRDQFIARVKLLE